jgi:hypothetical protein
MLKVKKQIKVLNQPYYLLSIMAALFIYLFGTADVLQYNNMLKSYNSSFKYYNKIRYKFVKF